MQSMEGIITKAEALVGSGHVLAMDDANALRTQLVGATPNLYL